MSALLFVWYCGKKQTWILVAESMAKPSLPHDILYTSRNFNTIWYYNQAFLPQTFGLVCIGPYILISWLTCLSIKCLFFTLQRLKAILIWCIPLNNTLIILRATTKLILQLFVSNYYFIFTRCIQQESGTVWWNRLQVRHMCCGQGSSETSMLSYII